MTHPLGIAWVGFPEHTAISFLCSIRQVQKLMKSYACTARKSTLEEVKSAIAV